MRANAKKPPNVLVSVSMNVSKPRKSIVKTSNANPLRIALDKNKGLVAACTASDRGSKSQLASSAARAKFEPFQATVVAEVPLKAGPAATVPSLLDLPKGVEVAVIAERVTADDSVWY